MQQALAEAREAGGNTHGGERIAEIGGENAYYVRPALCEMPQHVGPVLRETFAPILYVMRYSELDDAIRMHNSVGADLILPSLRSTCARQRDSSPQRARTAASPM
jgi:aldehyde dehydrogenase (NAD+)